MAIKLIKVKLENQKQILIAIWVIFQIKITSILIYILTQIQALPNQTVL
jgi:hypothetical protein